MKDENVETTTGMQSWYKISLLDGCNHIRAKPKLLRKRKGVYESFSSPSRKPKVIDTDNSAKLVKSYPGNIVHQRLIDLRRRALLRERHVDQSDMEYETVQNLERGFDSVKCVDWHFVSMTAVGEEAGGDEEERDCPKGKMPSEAFQKGGQRPQRRRPSRRPRGGHAEDHTSNESAHRRQLERKVPRQHCVVILGDQALFEDRRQLLMASKTQGQGEKQKQKQSRKRRFQRQGKRTLERHAVVLWKWLVGQPARLVEPRTDWAF